MSASDLTLEDKIEVIEVGLKFCHRRNTLGLPCLKDDILRRIRKGEASTFLTSSLIKPEVFEKISRAYEYSKTKLGNDDVCNRLGNLLTCIVSSKTSKYPPTSQSMTALRETRTKLQQFKLLNEWVQMKAAIERLRCDPPDILGRLKACISHGLRELQYCFESTDLDDLLSMVELCANLWDGVAENDLNDVDRYFNRNMRQLMAADERDDSEVGLVFIQPIASLNLALGSRIR